MKTNIDDEEEFNLDDNKHSAPSKEDIAGNSSSNSEGDTNAEDNSGMVKVNKRKKSGIHNDLDKEFEELSYTENIMDIDSLADRIRILTSSVLLRPFVLINELSKKIIYIPKILIEKMLLLSMGIIAFMFIVNFGVYQIYDGDNIMFVHALFPLVDYCIASIFTLSIYILVKFFYLEVKFKEREDNTEKDSEEDKIINHKYRPSSFSNREVIEDRDTDFSYEIHDNDIGDMIKDLNSSESEVPEDDEIEIGGRDGKSLPTSFTPMETSELSKLRSSTKNINKDFLNKIKSDLDKKKSSDEYKPPVEDIQETIAKEELSKDKIIAPPVPKIPQMNDTYKKKVTNVVSYNTINTVGKETEDMHDQMGMINSTINKEDEPKPKTADDRLDGVL